MSTNTNFFVTLQDGVPGNASSSGREARGVPQYPFFSQAAVGSQRGVPQWLHIFYQEGFSATTDTTVRPPLLTKTTEPLLQVVTIAASTVLSSGEIEERTWNRLLATPESDDFLDMLEEEALREYQEGRTEEGGFGKD